MRFSTGTSGLIPGLINIFYPARCPACNTSTDSFSHAPFCSRCWQSIERYAGPSCSICGVPLVSTHAGRCGNCMESLPAFSKAVSFGLYDGTLAAAIHHFKFFGIRRLAKPLAGFLSCVPTESIAAIVPVPLSPKGLRSRGFNQALLLAYHLSKKRNVPLMMDLLRKVADTPPQVGLSAKERAANVRKAFACTGTIPGMRILLIDDVMTTGATVNSCAKQLLKAGAKSVQVLTLARAWMR